MPTFGDPPITVSDTEFNQCEKTIRELVNEFRDRTKGSTSNKNFQDKDRFNARIEALTHLFLIGKTSRRQQAFLDFAQTLKDEFGISAPPSGALWGGDGAQDKAKSALAPDGQVLSQTQLGKSAARMKLAPQGPKQGETGLEFAERNQAALLFWGAVSALYAKGLTGDIHVWMPKGLTVGSIFWNDELPVLMKRKRDGEAFNLIFHINPDDWSQTVAFEDLLIGGAYLADKNGLYKGRESLKAEHNPPKGSDPAADLKDSMTLKLSSPIKLASVKFAMQSLLTYTTMKKANEQIKKASDADPGAQKPFSPAILARLAVWRELARQEADKQGSSVV